MQLLFLIIAIINYSQAQRRYIIDNDSDTGDNVALPLDYCFKNKVQGTTYLKYTCNAQNDVVTKTVYTNNTCATPTGTTATFATSDPGPCAGTPKFSCTGDDEYSLTGVYAQISGVSCTGGVASTKLPAALGCYCDSPSTSYTMDCTSSSSGTLTKYDTDATCSATNTPQALDICYQAFAYDYTPTLSIPISVVIENCVLAPSGGTSAPSPVTLSPTDATLQPSSSPTSVTVGPTVDTRTYETKFIVDNDWILAQNYPFPFDVCLQTAPKLDDFSITAEFLYYECDSNTNIVTKYKWTTSEEAGLDVGFDCVANKNSAVTTQIPYSASKTPCDIHYFVCTGQANYVENTFAAQLDFGADPNCDGNLIPLFSTSIATQACFCDGSASSKIVCGSSDAIAYNYTGQSCSTDAPRETVLGRANQCSHFRSVTPTEIPSLPFGLHIFGEMDRCVNNGADIQLATPQPTRYPTEDPTTYAPTPSPTKRKPIDIMDGTLSLVVYCNILIGLLGLTML